jgi:hypothetical protein
MSQQEEILKKVEDIYNSQPANQNTKLLYFLIKLVAAQEEQGQSSISWVSGPSESLSSSTTTNNAKQRTKRRNRKIL